MSEVTLLRTKIDARPAADIDRHPRRTLAEKRARCVDALAVDTYSRKHLTFIHIFANISFDSGKSFTTDGVFFTFGTGAVPGFSQCGTAVRLQRGSVDIDLTAVIDDLQPAGALSGLNTLQPSAVQRAPH